MKRLILFDVDGTLCDTCEVDNECYLRVAAEVLGGDLTTIDWSKAAQVTDAGILDWLWRTRFGRAPGAAEIARVVERFVAMLTEVQARSPHRFASVGGACEAVSALRGSGYLVAAATGGWRSSACLKLAAAGLAPDLLMASSDDSPDRVDVFRLASERARPLSGGDMSVVLVGDGVWDVEVARRLDWRFVGVACDDGKARRLRAAGAQAIVTDFRDLAGFERAVATSGVPA